MFQKILLVIIRIIINCIARWIEKAWQRCHKCHKLLDYLWRKGTFATKNKNKKDKKC